MKVRINIGMTDRIVRYILAAICILLFFSGQLSPVIAIGLLILGVMLLISSVSGVCPLYGVLGIHTNTTPQREK